MILFLVVAFIEWEVVSLLTTVFRRMSKCPGSDVINDSFWNRMPTFVMVHTIFGIVAVCLDHCCVAVASNSYLCGKTLPG